MQFITSRQFSPNDKSLPPLAKTLWWIPSATKNLALISKFTYPLLKLIIVYYKIILDKQKLQKISDRLNVLSNNNN